jgi:hypothetical protein
MEARVPIRERVRDRFIDRFILGRTQVRLPRRTPGHFKAGKHPMATFPADPLYKYLNPQFFAWREGPLHAEGGT